MIAERINQTYTSTKYYPFTTILEHVIDCFHTIVSDETNPYHPPLGWLTRKQIKPPDDELFSDLMDECSFERQQQSVRATTLSYSHHGINSNNNSNNYGQDKLSSSANDTSRYSLNHSIADSKLNQNIRLSSSVRSRLERFSLEVRKEIVSRTRDGCSPLFMACQNGLATIVRYLLIICNADIEQKGRYERIEDQHVHWVPPIWVAAISGHFDTVKLLIDRGANVNSLSDTGSTPLRSVCFLCKDDDNPKSGSTKRRDHSEMASTSSLDQVNIFTLDSDDSEFTSNDENLEKSKIDEENEYDDDDDDIFFRIAQLLVENGADISKANYRGCTSLINSLHNYQLTRYILDHGADVNVADNNGMTALHYAVHANRLNVTKLLLAHKANPMLKTNNLCDDALQLSCIRGHVDIFGYLVGNYEYSLERLSDAYKLIGSSILELHEDIGQVRSFWLKSIQIRKAFVKSQNKPTSTSNSNETCENYCDIDTTITQRRRALAFGANVKEFETENELLSLSIDSSNIQSLIISERILGKTHTETIQRLKYRGASYINSMRPDRCVDLWIYTLRSLISQESIFNFDTFLGARAIKKLFLDLISQQPQFVRFDDVYDVLDSLISSRRLEESVRLLSIRPRWVLHEDIFNLLLSIIINLVLLARCVERDARDRLKIDKIIETLVRVDPKASDGSSLLHVCATSSLFEGEAYRAILKLSNSSSLDGNKQASSPVLELIKQLIDFGLELDQVNGNRMSALQVFCLSSSRAQEKWNIIRLLAERGAHLDRRTIALEQQELIRLALRESGVNQLGSMRLSCLAARQVAKQFGLSSSKSADRLSSLLLSQSLGLSPDLRRLVEIH